METGLSNFFLINYTKTHSEPADMETGLSSFFLIQGAKEMTEIILIQSEDTRII